MVARRLLNIPMIPRLLNVEHKNAKEQYKSRPLFMTTITILNNMIVDYRVERIMYLLKLKAEMIDTQDSSLTYS